MRRPRRRSRPAWAGCWPRWPPTPGPAAAGRGAGRGGAGAGPGTGWNDTAAEVPGGSVPELIAAQAARMPGRGGGVVRGYPCDLPGADGRAGRLARVPARGGGGPGVGGRAVPGPGPGPGHRDRWRTWLAGAAYLPLDPGYPADRLAFMLADSGALVIVLAGGGLPAGLSAELAVDLDDPRTAAAVAAAGAGGGGSVPGGAAGVRDLHLRVDGDPEGGRGHPRRAAEFRGGARWTGSPGIRGAGCCSWPRPGSTPACWRSAWRSPPAGRWWSRRRAARWPARSWPRCCGRRRSRHALVVPSVLAGVPEGGLAGFGVLVVGGEALRRRPGGAVGAARRMVNAYGPTESTVMIATSGPWTGPGPRRSARRSPTRGCTCWTGGWTRCRPGWSGSCTRPGPGWPAATSAGPR